MCTASHRVRAEIPKSRRGEDHKTWAAAGNNLPEMEWMEGRKEGSLRGLRGCNGTRRGGRRGLMRFWVSWQYVWNGPEGRFLQGLFDISQPLASSTAAKSDPPSPFIFLPKSSTLL